MQSIWCFRTKMWHLHAAWARCETAGPIHTGRDARWANGTCWCECGCPHCMQATSKEKCSNLHVHCVPHPVWIKPEVCIGICVVSVDIGRCWTTYQRWFSPTVGRKKNHFRCKPSQERTQVSLHFVLFLFFLFFFHSHVICVNWA